MPVVKSIQNAFTAGELDPKLRARNDLATYYTGAAKLRNVLPIPQGAVKRRPGLEYIDRMTNGDVRICEFTQSATNKFILVLEPGLVTVYKDGMEMDTVAVAAITASRLPDITYAQTNDVMLLFHQEFSPVYVARTSDTSWSSGSWTINNVPSYNFSSTATTTNLDVTDVAAADIDFSTWVDGGTYLGKLTASGATFAASDVGRYVRGPLGGYFKITNYTDNTHVAGLILAPFTNELSDGSTTLTAGEWVFEDAVFSATKGYPACGAFHQGRLWLGSTPYIPNGIWASKTGDEEDFGNWIPSFADNGIFLVARECRTGFSHLFSGRHLTMLSSDSAYVVSTSNEEPITPTNASIKPLSGNIGAVGSIRPFEVSGSTLFMRKGGKSVVECTYSFADGSYIVQDLNLLASHILSSPVDGAYRKQTSTDESDYVIIINGDGTASILCILREQKVTAWSKIETEGRFKRVATDGTDIYFVVERTVNGTYAAFLERFNNDLLVDCGVIDKGVLLTSDATQLTYDSINLTYLTSSQSTITGMAHLLGNEVQIVVDNTVHNAQTVTSDTITLTSAGASAQAGLDFPIVDTTTSSRVYVESMPIELDAGGGNTTVGKKKRLTDVTVMLYETSHLEINKNSVPIRRIGVDTLDTGVPQRTENLTVRGILGWDDEIYVSVGQTLPLPMTLLGMAYKVKG